MSSPDFPSSWLWLWLCPCPWPMESLWLCPCPSTSPPWLWPRIGGLLSPYLTQKWSARISCYVDPHLWPCISPPPWNKTSPMRFIIKPTAPTIHTVSGCSTGSGYLNGSHLLASDFLLKTLKWTNKEILVIRSVTVWIFRLILELLSHKEPIRKLHLSVHQLFQLSPIQMYCQLS